MKSLRLLLATLLLAVSGLHAAVAEADFAKLAALMQANKDAEARALFADLLKASPNDPQLLTLAKQFGGSADKPRAITLDDLRGPVRIQYAAAEKILRDAMQDQLADAERKASLLDYLGRTAALLSEYPGLSALWLKRAGVALELNFPAVAREAGVKLVALGAADSADTRTLEILGELEIKRWLKPAPAGTAAEAGAAFTVGQAARLGEFNTEKEALATLLTDGSRSASEKQSAWEAFLRKWSIRDDGGPADAGRVRYAEQGPALAENEAMRRQAEERRLAEERQRQPIRIEDLGITMMPIPAGTFTMGSPADEPGRIKGEGPQTRVTLAKAFWLGQTEVTHGQWKAVMGSDLRDQVRKMLQDDTLYYLNGKKQTPRDVFGKERDSDPSSLLGPEGDGVPMHYVSWEDAREFCRRLTERERAAGRLPEGYAYTLPTEAQWEYACRAGTGVATYAGAMEIKGKRNAPMLDEIAWYGGNSSVGYQGKGWDTAGWPEKQYPGGNAGPRDVATKKANAYGLHDMLGNVAEWCLDWFAAYPGGSTVDPVGAPGGSERIVRGGSWIVFADVCRSAGRGAFVPGRRTVNLGFRLALSSVRGTSQ